ncbi:hypothetical protein ITX31_12675 [Arthrobacter gandavensis]|uniref:hypothetical protein n=1 Tax=Arthrobacter gandavensis TaxID=169960 RepID=UPI00188F0CB6|nr:hypothetical protein [Arthrobacter gandavensis]MBF4994964.1 hypothetical protein [Arthrobacter gandavensis]
MRSDWVAATVRAKALARRRAGAGLCRDAAALSSLEPAVELFEGTGYGPELAAGRKSTAGRSGSPASGPETDLAKAQHATRRSVLWQLRVLAGWLPVSGARMVRAAGAAFELANITVLTRRLQQDAAEDAGTPARPGVALPEYFELGGLATAWPRLSRAVSTTELVDMLRTSPWGDPGSPEDAADTLGAVWMRRLAAAAPQTGSWMVAGAALLAARRVLVLSSESSGGAGTRREPANRLNSLLQPMIGGSWQQAQDLASLRAALPAAAAPALRGIEDPADLWRAEAALRALVEEDAFRLLRSGLPGPDVAVGAVAVLAVDAWRVRAALAAAAAGGGSEVLDAVA